MQVRKVLNILSSASGRTLSCTLGHRACTESFLGGKSETSPDQGCGLQRQRVPCLPLSKAAGWTVHLQEGTTGSQLSSVQPEAFLDLQLHVHHFLIHMIIIGIN